MRKLVFAYPELKALISSALTAQLISAFVFASEIHVVQYMSYNPPACLVCVGPGRKHRRQVFSRRGSIVLAVCDQTSAQNYNDPIKISRP